MSYHDLSSSSLNDSERVDEAHRIAKMLEDNMDALSSQERQFVEKMADTRFCSVKQLFWLRDIKDRHL